MDTLPGRPRRLVVIDDDPDLRALTRLNLELDATVEVVGEADNGIDGLTLIEDLRPDVAIVDLVMPGIDGLALVRTLRERGTTVRIVAYSADLRGLTEALAAGADAAVSKSGPYGRLVEAILA